MVLTNGAGTAISGGDTVTKTGTSHAWAYDNVKITFTDPAKYYFNGVLKWTSATINSGEYYPYVSLRGAAALAWTFQKGTDEIGDFIQWTFSSNAVSGNKYLGFNDVATSEEGNMSGCHMIDNITYDHIRENGSDVGATTGDPTIYADDKFTIYYSTGGSAGGTFFPPPPAMVRL